jgi:hypothetical protein
MCKKGHIPWNKGKKISKKIKERISRTLKKKYANGLKSGFQKGHPCYSYNLKEWSKTHIVWNKGLPKHKQPGWKGGITNLNAQIRNLERYKEWRNKVFSRDNYICQICGIKSGLGKTIIFQADHIKSLAKILFDNKITTIEQSINCNELWDIGNGRTLCISCHGKTDNFLWKGLIVSANGRHKKSQKQRSKILSIN